MRTLKHADGLFAKLAAEVIGEPVRLDDLDPAAHPPALLSLAKRVWLERMHTEHRSVQVMTRFLTETVGAGDPFEVYAIAVELVRDEVKHTGLCAATCQALGAEPLLPNPIELRDPPAFLAAPMPERALHTAITMLAINETLSVAYIEDLRDRCTYAPIRRVLDATLDDEEGHQEFGWRYVRESLARFPASTKPAWRHLVDATLRPHRDVVMPILERIPSAKRHLEAFPDTAEIVLGLYTSERQALVFEKAYRERLAPKLRELDLLA